MSYKLHSRGGTWYIHFTHPKSGERIRVSAKTKDKSLADKLGAKLYNDAYAQAHFNAKPKYLWAEAVVRYVKESSHIRAMKDIHTYVTWLQPYLNDKTLDQIDKELIYKIRDIRLAEGKANATVNRILQFIRAVLNRAYKDWEWIDRVPHIKLLKEEKRERVATPGEIERLATHLPRPWPDMMYFNLETGLRLGNILGLKWEWVDFENQTATYPSAEFKTDRVFTVPLSAKAMDLIRLQPKHSTYVFTREGRRIKELSSKLWQRACRDANVEDLRWHDLRHTFASRKAAAGVPIEIIQRLLGHTTIQTTDRYRHLSVVNLRQYVEDKR